MKLEVAMVHAFDWIQFPEGRARFAGTFRCWDEQGRKTFALELSAKAYFGEIERTYLDNDSDYNVSIGAFGYGRGEDIGMPGFGVRAMFTHADEIVARSMVIRLVHAGLELSDPPTVLDQTETSRFMGKVIFQEGWMLISPCHATAE